MILVDTMARKSLKEVKKQATICTKSMLDRLEEKQKGQHGWRKEE